MATSLIEKQLNVLLNSRIKYKNNKNKHVILNNKSFFTVINENWLCPYNISKDDIVVCQYKSINELSEANVYPSLCVFKTSNYVTSADGKTVQHAKVMPIYGLYDLNCISTTPNNYATYLIQSLEALVKHKRFSKIKNDIRWTNFDKACTDISNYSVNNFKDNMIYKIGIGITFANGFFKFTLVDMTKCIGVIDYKIDKTTLTID